MATNTKNICLLVGFILVVLLLVSWCKNKTPTVSHEPYVHAGAIDNVGSIETSYELVNSPDDNVPAPHFADLVDDGNHPDIVSQPQNAGDAVRPMERLNRIHNRNMLPKIAAGVTPYQVDVANTSVFSFAAQTPRVQLKSPVWTQSDPFRGDIAITYTPDTCMVAKSQYGRDAARFDGFFSDHFNSMYEHMNSRAFVNMCNTNKGKAFKNLPQKISTQGTIMDYDA